MMKSFKLILLLISTYAVMYASDYYVVGELFSQNN